MKRPLSRKKDPSAAVGLGELAGPARVTDAFEVRKMRQPIPVESWGQRPPSRAGQKATPLDTTPEEPKMLLVQSRSVSSSMGASPPKAVGGTWASARAEPRDRNREQRNTFNTNLDMDFLSLFAT